MENNTAPKPINITEIELTGILDRVAQEQLNSDPKSTMPELPTSYDNTATSNNNYPENINYTYYYNRKVSRYAKKHKITCEEAFKRLYK